jgi:hypothetical protein
VSDDELRRMYFRAIKPVSSLLDFIAFARSLEAARTSPTADDAKPVGEAVAWLWNEKPCEFNDYQSRPRVTFVRPKNTEAPGGMQALGVIAATAQRAKDSGDAQDAKRYRWIKETDWQPAAIEGIERTIDAAIASAEREGK